MSKAPRPRLKGEGFIQLRLGVDDKELMRRLSLELGITMADVLRIGLRLLAKAQARGTGDIGGGDAGA